MLSGKNSIESARLRLLLPAVRAQQVTFRDLGRDDVPVLTQKTPDGVLLLFAGPVQELERRRIRLAAFTGFAVQIGCQLDLVVGSKITITFLRPIDVLLAVRLIMLSRDRALAGLTVGVAPALCLVLPGELLGIFRIATAGACALAHAPD